MPAINSRCRQRHKPSFLLLDSFRPVFRQVLKSCTFLFFMLSGLLKPHNHPSLIPLISENQPFPAYSLLSFRECSNLNTTLSYIAAQKGICIAPGFTNDHNGEFAWIPFDCPERIRCVFGYHKNDRKESTRIFIELSQNAYQNTEKGQFL